MARIISLQIACTDGPDQTRLMKLLGDNGYAISGDKPKITALATDGPLLDQHSAIERVIQNGEADSMDKIDMIKDILESENPWKIVKDLEDETKVIQAGREA